MPSWHCHIRIKISKYNSWIWPWALYGPYWANVIWVLYIDFRYRNAVNQYAQLIRQRYAENEIKVEVMNHPVPQWKQVNQIKGWVFSSKILKTIKCFANIFSDNCFDFINVKICFYYLYFDAVWPGTVFGFGITSWNITLGVGK